MAVVPARSYQVGLVAQQIGLGEQQHPLSGFEYCLEVLEQRLHGNTL
ncbi:hypothetical protein ACYZTM_00775 [Pseudomonas sp. MDT2-39-1]